MLPSKHTCHFCLCSVACLLFSPPSDSMWKRHQVPRLATNAHSTALFLCHCHTFSHCLTLRGSTSSACPSILVLKCFIVSRHNSLQRSYRSLSHLGGLTLVFSHRLSRVSNLSHYQPFFVPLSLWIFEFTSDCVGACCVCSLFVSLLSWLDDTRERKGPDLWATALQGHPSLPLSPLPPLLT